METKEEKLHKELFFEGFEIHTFGFNNTDSRIAISADGYLEGEEVTLTFFLPDYDFIKFISHKEIDIIKENLKKHIDEL
jgi:hypothetical protein